ncbi:recombinase family protein [Nioella sp. MMSF_3534]|uniref:recombinase family protein n=1 Tax=Nioella sp. MMSF_3534 TaxID=3046720 RepID=UPI00273E75A4|nr:recombinase family protein [Nioella sp. MMSF_3534]
MPRPPADQQRLGVALLRVSTEKQFQEGESIEAQRRKVEFVAKRQHIDIVSFFVEHYSGRKTDRRTLDDMFAFLEANKDVSFVLVGDIDRLTRGGTEIYLALKRRLYEMGVELIDTTGIIQPSRNRLEHLGVEYSWAVESPSHYAEIFMAEKARAEASDILTRTIGEQIQLTRQGYQVRPPNYGYQNVKITTEDGKKKTIMEPHPEQASFIRRIFQLRAEGKTTDEQIAQHVNAMGYKSRVRRVFDPVTRKVVGMTKQTKMTAKQVQRLVRKPIYCGIRLEAWNNGVPVEAPIEPLVSVHLFNAANRGEVVVSKQSDGSPKVSYNSVKYKNHKHNPEFLLRHVVLCPVCGKPFLASRSKSKSGKYHGYYHCSRGHKHRGYAKAEFEGTVANYLVSLQAKPGFLGLFREVVRDVWIQKNRARFEAQRTVEDQIQLLQTKQASVIDKLAICSSPIVLKRLENEVEEIEAAIEEARKAAPNSQINEADIDRFFQIAKMRMEHPEQAILNAVAKPEIERDWGFIFETPPSIEEIQNGTPQLTLLYRFNRDFPMDERQMVAHTSLHWNTFECYLAEIISQFPGLNLGDR